MAAAPFAIQQETAQFSPDGKPVFIPTFLRTDYAPQESTSIDETIDSMVGSGSIYQTTADMLKGNLRDGIFGTRLRIVTCGTFGFMREVLGRDLTDRERISTVALTSLVLRIDDMLDGANGDAPARLSELVDARNTNWQNTQDRVLKDIEVLYEATRRLFEKNPNSTTMDLVTEFNMFIDTSIQAMEQHNERTTVAGNNYSLSDAVKFRLQTNNLWGRMLLLSTGGSTMHPSRFRDLVNITKIGPFGIQIVDDLTDTGEDKKHGQMNIAVGAANSCLREFLKLCRSPYTDAVFPHEQSLHSQLGDMLTHFPRAMHWVLRHKRLLFNHSNDGPLPQNAYHVLERMVSDEKALEVLKYVLFNNRNIEKTISPRSVTCGTALIHEIAMNEGLDDNRFTGLLYLSAMMRIFDDFVDDEDNRHFFLNPSTTCRDMLIHPQIKDKIIPLLHGLHDLLFTEGDNNTGLLTTEKKSAVIDTALDCFNEAFKGVKHGAALLQKKGDRYSVEEVSQYRRDTTDQFARLATEILGNDAEDGRFLEIYTNIIDYFQIFEDITDIPEDSKGRAFNYALAAMHEFHEDPNVPFSRETHPRSYEVLVNMARDRIINVFGYVPFYFQPDQVMAIVGGFGNPSKTEAVKGTMIEHFLRFFHQW
jgi:hypothetical protein